MSKFLQNLNQNILCSIDVETTGFIPGQHDLIQVAAIPLNRELKCGMEYTPFLMDIKPKRPENEISSEAMRINRMKYCEIVTRGMDAYDAADRFVEWFYSLKLGENARLCPLACNWPFDRAFLMEWLGPSTFDLIFHAHYRDVMVIAAAMNDIAGWKGEEFPYPKLSLSYLCNHMRIERTRAHDATDDARVTIDVYKRLITGL